ncbi:MAG: SET domain-containing protein-lysine N-methyltransferase [Inquilinaceae bacterium]
MSVLLATDKAASAPRPGYWSSRPSLAGPGPSRRGGRGLFALGTIEAGTLIERACSVEVAPDQAPALDAMRPVGDFYFEHPEDKRAGLMAFGLMSLCNHANAPNADVRWARDKDIGWVADLVALDTIAAGEEITYRYKCPLWFAPAA